MQGVEASLGVATMSRAEGIAEAATWGGRCRQRAERRALDRVVSCREKKCSTCVGYKSILGKE